MMRNFTIESFFKTAPPHLSRLFGYTGARRWVAFYWNGDGEGPNFPWHFDGQETGPINRSAWEAFLDHKLVLAHNYRRVDGFAIKRFEFGSDRFAASHWLLLDRQNRCLFAGPGAEVAKFITIFMDEQPEKVAVRDSEILQTIEPDFQTTPVQDGAMENISYMVAWLDWRLSILKKNGKWPIFGD